MQMRVHFAKAYASVVAAGRIDQWNNYRQAGVNEGSNLNRSGLLHTFSAGETDVVSSGLLLRFRLLFLLPQRIPTEDSPARARTCDSSFPGEGGRWEKSHQRSD